MKHLHNRWNPATGEHFCSNCGRTSDAINIADAQGGTIRNPEWGQLCQAALLETNTVRLLERIARAQNEILDRIDGYSKSPNGEQPRCGRHWLR